MRIRHMLCIPMLMAHPFSCVFAQDRERPNVIVIYADDLGWGDVGCYGAKDVETPHIDALASSGVRFTNGYVTASVSGPSRAGMMTGVYQQRFAYYGNSLKCRVPQDQPTLAEYLQRAGYATGMMGKWHLGETDSEAPEARGFDYFYGMRNGSHSYYQSTVDVHCKNYDLRPIYRNNKIQPPLQETGGYLTEILTDEATQFIDQNAEKPFFVYLAYNAVHYPWQVPQKYVDRLDQLQVHHEDRRVFAAMLLAMDDGVGQIMETLRRNNIEENTLIFFVSDNGSPRGQGLEVKGTDQNKDRGGTVMSSPAYFRGFKGDTYEGGIRVPFIASWKGRIPAGLVSDEPVISLDIVPTVLSAAGVKERQNEDVIALDGVDLIAFLDEESSLKKMPHRNLYWRRDQDYAIRQGVWKLAFNDQGSTRRIQLFNLEKDPAEMYDLSEMYPEKAQELQNLFDAWDSGLPDYVHRKNPSNRNAEFHHGRIRDVKKINAAIYHDVYQNIDLR